MSKLNFIYRMELSHRAVSVYIYLADKANKDGECWPAIPTIASELKLSHQPFAEHYRICGKQGCLKPNSDIALKAAKAVCFTKLKANKAAKNIPSTKGLLHLLSERCHLSW